MEFFGFLLALSLWGWLLVFLAVVLLTVLVESERGTMATFVTAGIIASMIYWTHFNLYSAVIYHPLTWAEWIVGWFIVGAVWGIVKWTLDLHKALGKYTEAKAQFLSEKKAEALTPALAAEFSERLSRSYGYALRGAKDFSYTSESQRPQVRHHPLDDLLAVQYDWFPTA